MHRILQLVRICLALVTCIVDVCLSTSRKMCLASPNGPVKKNTVFSCLIQDPIAETHLLPLSHSWKCWWRLMWYRWDFRFHRIHRALNFETPVLLATVCRHRCGRSATSSETLSISLEPLDVIGHDCSCMESNFWNGTKWNRSHIFPITTAATKSIFSVPLVTCLLLQVFARRWNFTYVGFPHTAVCWWKPLHALSIHQSLD